MLQLVPAVVAVLAPCSLPLDVVEALGEHDGQLMPVYAYTAHSFFEQIAHHRRVDVDETGQFQDSIEAADAIEYEVDVGERSAVIGHVLRLRPDGRR